MMADFSGMEGFETRMNKLLVKAITNRIKSSSFSDMYRTAQNIVDTKIVYDQLVKVYQANPGNANVQTCLETFRTVMRMIKTTVFRKIDAFSIARDTATLPEKVRKRVVTDSVAVLKLGSPEAGTLSELLWEVVEALQFAGEDVMVWP